MAHLVSTIMATLADLAETLMKDHMATRDTTTDGDAVKVMWRSVQNLLQQGSQDRKTIQKLEDEYHKLKEIHVRTQSRLEHFMRRHHSDQEYIRDRRHCFTYATLFHLRTCVLFHLFLSSRRPRRRRGLRLSWPSRGKQQLAATWASSQGRCLRRGGGFGIL